MVGYMRDRARRVNSIALACIAGLGLLAAYTSTRLSGTKTGLALALGTTIGPILLYVAVTAPLVFPFGLYAMLTPFDNILDFSSFGTITRIVGLASGGALLFYMLRNKRFGDPHRNMVFWLLLYLWMAMSAMWAVDSQNSIAMLNTALQLLALYVILAMLRVDLRGLGIVLGWVLLGGLFAAVYGLYMYHSGAGVFGQRLWIHTDTSAWNPDQFAAALLLPIGIALYAALWGRGFFMRAISCLVLVVMVSALFVSGARGPTLALLALVLYVMLRDHRRVKLLLLSAPLAIAALAISGSSFLQRWNNAATSGGAGRIEIWKVGVAAFQQNWLFGAGYNNFMQAYDKAFIHVYQPLFANWGRAPHNILLGTAVELGVIGLVLLLLAWWGQFRLLSSISPNDVRFPLRTALEGVLIALFICGMFADIMIQKYVWLAFMIVALTYNAAPQLTPEKTASA